MKSKYDNYFKIGDKYNKWTILENKIVRVSKSKESGILCECDCGIKKEVACITLINKTSKGCFNCGHNKRGENSPVYTGYKEIPGSWFLRYKQTAEKKNLDFKITIENIYDIWKTQNQKCALSGINVDFINSNFRIESKRKNKNFNYDLICTASLDRINSKKGYIIDNVQIVHKDINMMKKEYDQEYFIKMCKLIANKFI